MPDSCSTKGLNAFLAIGGRRLKKKCLRASQIEKNFYNRSRIKSPVCDGPPKKNRQ